MDKAENIDAYIARHPKNVQRLLQQLRLAIKKAAPEATETISYGIPAFQQNGALVHFGAYKDHIGFFPTSSGIAAFKEELSPYDLAKGTVRLPLDKELPLALISKIVTFRVEESRTVNAHKRPASKKSAIKNSFPK